MSAVVLDFTLAKAHRTYIRSRALLTACRLLLARYRRAEANHG